MSAEKFKYVGPFGFIDVPALGREGDAPHWECSDPANCHPEHEHELVGEHSHGSGPVANGEVITVPSSLVDEFKARSDWEHVVTRKPKPQES